jgi:hypothetical protein
MLEERSAIARRSSNIYSCTSLTFANDPLFLSRFCQPTPVLLSRNPFRAQPVFHPHLRHASALRPHCLLLRNALAPLSKLSCHSPCTLFGPVPRIHPCLLQSIMVCLTLLFPLVLIQRLIQLFAALWTPVALSILVICSFIYGCRPNVQTWLLNSFRSTTLTLSNLSSLVVLFVTPLTLTPPITGT